LAAVATFTGYAVARQLFDLDLDQSRTMATLVLVGVGLVVLVHLAQPLTAWRLGLVAAMLGAFTLVLALPFTREFFALDLPPPEAWVAIAGLVAGFTVTWRLARRVVPAIDVEAP
jgi:cation-transporting ATPase E